MCFSRTADLVVGAALVPFAVAALREVRHSRELPFALLPAVFAVHQFIEAAVWPSATSDAFAIHLAVRAYLFIAMSLLPTLVPLSVLLLEPHGLRLRVAPFVVLGGVVSAYLGYVVLCRPVKVVVHPHALEYQHSVQYGVVWAVLYIIAVIGPALLSGYPSIVAFGILNLVGLVVVAVVYIHAFASLWCIYAAAVSVLVVVHMIRRRRLPDAHRSLGGALHSAIRSI
ncbi:DUF6629 family protein [Mycobacterium angelicum]|uniref:Uncharacterized protein n=1 Tax=Mycobacterium angelicum TaxID=470074 RepID=A0A1W9ZV55_MYCAN|nr:DUF6629 family protein [Mycobacterium angelicum]MCV7200246.1 hypothetical protein [Mycobacterium angelicum]ORA21667.1 hypothetical protein BST12_11415 [Mycobacterium angelicum]